MMRSSGSVPEGRTKIRPRSPRLTSCAAIAVTRSVCSHTAAGESTSTLISNCGALVRPDATSLNWSPASCMATSTCSPAIMASPVLHKSKVNICPEGSPPSVHCRWCNASMMCRSPTFALTKGTDNSCSARSNPKFDITVPTTPPCSVCLACRLRVMTYSK